MDQSRDGKQPGQGRGPVPGHGFLGSGMGSDCSKTNSGTASIAVPAAVTTTQHLYQPQPPCNLCAFTDVTHGRLPLSIGTSTPSTRHIAWTWRRCPSRFQVARRSLACSSACSTRGGIAVQAPYLLGDLICPDSCHSCLGSMLELQTVQVPCQHQQTVLPH